MRKGSFLIPSILIAGGIGLFYAYRMKTVVEALTARIVTVKLNYDQTKQFFFSKIFFDIGVAVNNPNPEDIKIDGIFMSVFYNGKSVANANRTEAFTIKPQSTTTAVITAGIDTLNLFQNIQGAIDAVSNKQPLQLNFIGGVNVPVGSIKINQTVNVI